MDNKTYPPASPFGTSRLATINDIPRIAVVATAGFFYSPVFPWERRFHKQYLEDTVKGYQKRYADLIRDPKPVVVVAEDSYQPTENTATGATILANLDNKAPQQGDSVIVGIAAWKLPAGSVHIGQFASPDDLNNSMVFDGGLARNKDMSYAIPMYEVIEVEEDNLFRGHLIVEMLVVHPAYWRRGHGKALIKWGLELAETDGVKSGVFATVMGEPMYLSLGYVRAGVIGFEGRRTTS